MKTLAQTCLIALIGLSVATVATSQTRNQGNPPPIDEIAAELGVSTDDFDACASGERPEPGARPSAEEHEAMLTTIADCLQSSNSSITAAQIGEVMEKYRPAPPNQG